jgi:hypothetical protein
VAAGLGPPTEHALLSLLALNGLRVSEATGASIEALGIERGHRTLVITRKGGKVVTVPLAPRTARAIDLAIGERTEGPIFLTADGSRLDRHGAGRIGRIVRRTARRAGSPSMSDRTPCGTRSSHPRWTQVSRCGTSRKPPPARAADLDASPRSLAGSVNSIDLVNPRASHNAHRRARPGCMLMAAAGETSVMSNSLPSRSFIPTV